MLKYIKLFFIELYTTQMNGPWESFREAKRFSAHQPRLSRNIVNIGITAMTRMLVATKHR